MAKNITDADWKSVVMENKLPVLVDFWAPWCGPCRSLSVTIEELSKKYKCKVEIVKYNIDESSENTMKYGIRSVPTLLFFKNGELVKTINGAVHSSTIEEAFNEMM